MENKLQEKKNLEREVRELDNHFAEKKRLSGINVVEDELTFKKKQLDNLKKI